MKLANGYDDTCLNAIWDANPEDERWIDRQFLAIKMGKVPVDDFERKLYRRLNGESARFEDSNSAPLFEPLKVTEPKKDLVVYSGMSRIAQLVVGKSSQYFTFYAVGTSTAEEKPSDYKLGAENYRVSMVTDGYAEAAGITMRFAGKFPTYMASATITEAGVFDLGGKDAGTMLFRTVFPQESWLSHVATRTFLTCTQQISQVSVS